MSRTEAWKTWEGRVVDGKYPLRQWLGGSDHSAVFLTQKLGKGNENAAIKLIEADGPDADRELARLRAAAKLSHPNLISIFEAGRARLDSTPVLYFVMEFAEEDLSQILPQRPLAPSEVSDMLAPLLDALSYLLDNGLVHGRIRPSNVLAVGDQLKLSSDHATKIGEPNSVRRAIGVYDAPEISSGLASPESDVWSLGVTIVAALTQKAVPAAQGDPGLPGGLPEPFRGIARECLHHDPKQRCSVADIRARLQPAGRSVPAESSVPAAVSVPAESVLPDYDLEPVPESSSNLRSIVIGIVLVVVAALVVWGLMRPRATDTVVETPETSQPSPQPAPATAPLKPDPVTPSKRTGSASNPTTTGTGGAVVHQVIPDIPKSARNTITGVIKVSVRVEVDPSGKVTSEKLKTTGPSKYFAGQALKAAQGWQFAPAQADGQPTTSAWLLTFRFRRGSTDASPERLSR
jgi:TonB family protein